jgi:dTDP-4-dehydrorhamnose reductase
MAEGDEPWLVVGGDSLVGAAVLAELDRAGVAALGTTRRSAVAGPIRPLFDLTWDADRWNLPARADVVVLCAAVARHADCKRDPAGSFSVNVTATVALAKRMAESGAFIVFPSSNVVFDGLHPKSMPADATNPRSEYGRQKATAERELLAIGAGVVRLTKVFGSSVPLFEGWLGALRSHEPIHPFDDMVMAPVPVGFVAQTLLAVGRRRAAGITQASGEVDVSYAEAARFGARLTASDQRLVQPVSYRSAGIEPEDVPDHTTLDTSRLHEELGLEPPPIWTTIERSFRGLS